MARVIELGGSMKKKTSWILFLLAFAVLFIVATALYEQLGDDYRTDPLVTEDEKKEDEQQDSTEDSDQTKELNPATDFSVVDQEGNEVKLSDLQGKPVVLNFWASWCGPCKSEMPDFQKIFEEYQDNIHFMMVNLTDGSQETVDSATAFIEDEGYSFPVYFDTKLEAATTYNIYSVPQTYFVDAEGNLVAYVTGAIDESILLQGINMIYKNNE